MARKTGLGPQGRRTIDEARASDTASKGAFSEIPGRVESGQTEAPTDTIPGYVTAAERPKRKRKGGIGGIGRGLIDGDRSSNYGKTQAGSVIDAANRVAGMIPPAQPNDPKTTDDTPSPSGPSGPGSASPSGPRPRPASYPGGLVPPTAQPTNTPSYPSGPSSSGPRPSGPPSSYPGGLVPTSTGNNGTPQSGVPWLDLGLKAAKMMVTPSPYAPMTWMERNLSPEGMSMLYGRGSGIQPLNGYETSRFHIQPKKKDPSDNFHSARHDPNIAEQAPLEQRRLDGSFQGDVELPAFRQGGQTTASERLHRDPLHENATQNLWGTPHEAAMGNLSGDVHTRTTRGFGDSSPSGRVESIRAPKPE